jgi:hypothetical protein
MKVRFGPVLGALVAVSASASASKPSELHFGGEPWHLELSLGDMKPIQGLPGRPDRDVFTYSDDRGTVLSLVVENAHEPATIASCREVFARRKQGMAAMQPVNEVQGQRRDAVTQEYDLTLDLKGKPILQHNIYSCRVRGNYYIDVHASRIAYRPSDHDALMSIIDAVRIID